MNDTSPYAPCNICGGTTFVGGPNERLSVTGRLPHCKGCHSLERHRIAYRVLEKLSPQFTKGTRMLQFSADPGLAKSWFAEHVLSVWQGPNSLDAQDIALAEGRFDWIYSSHVLNHLPNDVAAIQEMARVVGESGVVVLSVGGTEFNYKPRPSATSFGRDYQYRIYGTEFADDVLGAVPDVSVLELVTTDPCTGSLDSIYLCSRAEARLREMAAVAAASNIHARVFPARSPRAAEASALPRERVEPTVRQCSICGGTDLTFGPGQRRSSPHGHLPGCRTCGSLERHRIMHRVMGPLAPTFTAGKKLLQLDVNPGLLPAWFEDVRVSPRGQEASLDPNDTGLPSGSYDWASATHLVSEALDDKRPVAELLRVVGAHGVVALSLRGSATKYESVWKLRRVEDLRSVRDDHGAEFVDEVLDAFPGVAVLELVTSEPTTDSVDAIYLLSPDGAKLKSIAADCDSATVFARFFQSGHGKTARRAASLSDWDNLRREVESWKRSSSARFWLRDDDAGSYTPALANLVDVCSELDVPLALAVIPDRLRADLVEAVERNSLLTVLQHGFDHKNRSATKQSSEFPEERPLNESLEFVERGWNALTTHFGARALPVFVPPWGECSSSVFDNLARVGIHGFSGSQVGPFRPVAQCRRGAARSRSGLLLAPTHLAINRPSTEDTSPLPKVRNLAFLTRLVSAVRSGPDQDEPIGIMTHAWGVDVEVSDFLRELVEVTRSAGAEWVSAGDLFERE